MNILSPSILSADFSRLGDQINQTELGGAKFLHIDVMDGVFVPSITFGMCVIQSIRKVTQMNFDVHLMISEPIRYIKEFSDAGADIITIHYEACKNVEETLEFIHKCGCKAGISIKPSTRLDVLKPFIQLVDLILIMSVEPGFGGQVYIKESTQRIMNAKKMILDSTRQIYLEVDGGIRIDNVKTVLEAGADVIVAGSAIFNGDIVKNTTDFMNILNVCE